MITPQIWGLMGRCKREARIWQASLHETRSALERALLSLLLSLTLGLASAKLLELSANSLGRLLVGENSDRVGVELLDELSKVRGHEAVNELAGLHRIGNEHLHTGVEERRLRKVVTSSLTEMVARLIRHTICREKDLLEVGVVRNNLSRVSDLVRVSVLETVLPVEDRLELH